MKKEIVEGELNVRQKAASDNILSRKMIQMQTFF